jgi:hypothetical protein
VSLKAVETGPRKVESLAERVKRMQEEARSLATAEVGRIAMELDDLCCAAGEVASTKALPEGIANELRGLQRDIQQRLTTIAGIRSRL